MYAELCQHMPGCGAVAWPAGPAAALLSTLNSVMHTVHVSALLSDAPSPAVHGDVPRPRHSL